MKGTKYDVSYCDILPLSNECRHMIEL